jgi:hypothetical protein
MKVKINGKEVEKDMLGEVLHSLTHKRCKCNKCGESVELNFPESALSFVSIHERDCGSDAEIEITTPCFIAVGICKRLSKEVVRA